MKLLKIFKSAVNKDTQLLSISKLEEYYQEIFVYSFITNDQIRLALSSPLLNKVDPNIEWEEDSYLSKTNLIKDMDKHSFRVASIIQSILELGLYSNLYLDTMGAHYICALPDGHHRIRAIQYLGLDYAPFTLSGYVSENIRLVKFCKFKIN